MLHGPGRPRLVVVDPRPTPAAREADVWLPIRSGTNVALLNAIQHELIANGSFDRRFLDEHTVGLDALESAMPSSPRRRTSPTSSCRPRSGATEEAFGEFKRISAGRPCDYSGLSYEKLRGGSGIQWPCNAEFPDGCERLYTSHEFPTHAE